MGTGQSFSSQFLPHAGPRGPNSLSPAGMAGVVAPSGVSPVSMSPVRAPGTGPLYGGQRVPQHTYPGPPPQSQQLPRQSLKRAYSNEVSACIGEGYGMWGPPFPVVLTPWPHRGTQHSSTSRAGSTLQLVPSMPPAPPSPPVRPPHTLATGCSRAWANTSPLQEVPDPITRYHRGNGGQGVEVRVSAIPRCHPLETLLLP